MVRVAFIAVLALGCQTRIDAFRFDAGAVPGTDGGTVVAAPSWHATFAVRNGTLFGWGEGRALQSNPTRVPRSLAAPELVQLASGDASWCGLDRQGAVWCQGDNLQGELGTADTAPRTSPFKVPLPSAAKRIALTHWHTCALLVDGSLYCWGLNSERQLTAGTSTAAAPFKVPGTWLDVDVGDGHTCALNLNGEPFCWGRNTDGQLGTGTGSAEQQQQPTAVPGGLTLSAIRTSMLGTCGLTAAGEIWCWGRRLPDVGGEGPLDFSPVRIENTGGWRGLALGPFHVCAQREDRSLWCLGRNVEGQLGLGDNTLRPAMVQISTDVDSVRLGRFHTCFTRGGELLCAGRNDEAQLGVGDLTNRNRWVAPQFP